MYRARRECQNQCVIKLNGQVREEVNELEYYDLILCKNASVVFQYTIGVTQAWRERYIQESCSEKENDGLF